MDTKDFIDSLKKLEAESIVYYKTIEQDLVSIKNALVNDGYEVFVLDPDKNIKDKDELMNAFYYQAKFPDFFGANWDAVDECLNYYEHLPAKGYIFIYIKPSLLKEKSVQNFSILLDVMKDASSRWKKEERKPFKLV